MHYRLLILLQLFAFGLRAQQSTNEQVLARAELGRKTIELGDQIWLEVNISAPPGTELSGLTPGYLNELPGLETIQEKDLDVVAETPERLLQQRFLVTSFDTGYIAIPPLPFVFRAPDGRVDTALTNDLLLKVNALPVSDDGELQPIKPIIEEPLNLLDFWWLFVLLALAASGYLAYQYRQRQRQIAPPPPPPPPAHEVALAELDQLERQQLWQQDQTKAYYSELTRILREYLEGRFDVQAMEMTTRQITSALDRRTDFDADQSKELGQLLQLSDLVKFAKARPAAELHPEGLRRVRSFVKKTIFSPEVVTEVTATTATAAAAPTATTTAVDERPATVSPPTTNERPQNEEE